MSKIHPLYFKIMISAADFQWLGLILVALLCSFVFIFLEISPVHLSPYYVHFSKHILLLPKLFMTSDVVTYIKSIYRSIELFKDIQILIKWQSKAIHYLPLIFSDLLISESFASNNIWIRCALYEFFKSKDTLWIILGFLMVWTT